MRHDDAINKKSGGQDPKLNEPNASKSEPMRDGSSDGSLNVGNVQPTHKS